MENLYKTPVIMGECYPKNKYPLPIGPVLNYDANVLKGWIASLKYLDLIATLKFYGIKKSIAALENFAIEFPKIALI